MKQMMFWAGVGRVVLLSMLLCLPLSLMAAAQPPQELVIETTNRIIKALQAEQAEIKKNPARLYEIVDEIVLPHFDFRRMSSWVLGKHWRKASPAEREQFVKEFRALLVRTYAAALNDNYDQEIDFLPLRTKKEATEVTVRTEVQLDAGFPIPINYRMYRTEGGEWLVFDVKIDSVSLVTNYRSSFSKEIRQGGLPKLIAKLSERNQRVKRD
ncbi:MAG: ABC transporter substrate-binding protein [Gammaproteobacteria bacterium]|nr:ABC transporter substrate-binding protein [Gammaproteobacteria bacterium]MCF6362665.1 ABC transporter substrate-binding protein [Gammaproteobacteria bacterium]